ncbi:hypothetical protein LLEC1_05586 [Akanthomyces lecanii]|uniref:Zn(2)-C6 fungal-type domain-containing protein n=1 Tax=Cordyceps confragosa TaxID=2714763 RepID=A0A179IKF5_CORDF|nr:hypothetical protein LLEC1_05586 [Akanthomyces lecanii]
MISLGNPKQPDVKRRRTTQACDYCHQRSIRCRPSENGSACQNCEAFAQQCTYNRKPRKRGNKPRQSNSNVTENLLRTDATQLPRMNQAGFTHDNSNRGPDLARVGVSHVLSPIVDPWRAPAFASQAVVMDLVEIYFEIVYPIFPFFHRPSFSRRISRGEYTTSKSLFALTMAVCALVSGRVRDGAVTNMKWDMPPLYALRPRMFYEEAKHQLIGLMNESDIDVVRAHAILAITAIQEGKTRDLHMHLGIYHTLIAMGGLHDESNWPRDTGIIEREERRRLVRFLNTGEYTGWLLTCVLQFWSMYTLDIYSAVVWGSIIRCREYQSNVAYPVEADDELIDDNGIIGHDVLPREVGPICNSPGANGVDCWLYGWNFTTDLYRVLEHALAGFQGRRCQASRSAFLREIFEEDATIAKRTVQAKVIRKYHTLPESFKHTPQMTYNINTDRFGFQAANITATVQLLRIVLLAVDGATVEERCEIASDVVGAFTSVPVAYLLSIGAPLLYHLGGIGTILASVTEEPLNLVDFERIRHVMLSLAQLLENLEVIQHGASASKKLRALVSHIDEDIARKKAAAPPENLLANPDILEQTMIQSQEQQNQFSMDRPDWMLEISGDILGDLTWNFDLA